MKKQMAIILIFYYSVATSQEINFFMKDGSTKTVSIFELDFINIYPVEIPTDTLRDIDGNIYKTVKIGNQWWMAENLRVVHFSNGDLIPYIANFSEWINVGRVDSFNGGYCNYNNDENNGNIFGRLYHWKVVSDSRKLAPKGWHIPSSNEWETLLQFLGGKELAGNKMKVPGDFYWFPPNVGSNNISKFSALPGGCREFSRDFFELGLTANFWGTPSSDREWPRRTVIQNGTSNVIIENGSLLEGYSVRCIKDN